MMDIYALHELRHVAILRKASGTTDYVKFMLRQRIYKEK